MSFSPADKFILTKPCARFTPIIIPPDEKKAVIYVKLRKDGCDRKSAKKFVCRPNCKTDTTRAKDGPVKCRTLQPKKTPYAVINHVIIHHIRASNPLNLGVEHLRSRV